MKNQRKNSIYSVLFPFIFVLILLQSVNASVVCVNNVTTPSVCNSTVTGTIRAAVASAVTGDTILVGDNLSPMTSLGCKSFYANEVIDASSKTLKISADIPDICVSGNSSNPLIKFYNSGNSFLGGFKMWIRGSRSIVLSNTTLLVEKMGFIGDSPIAILVESNGNLELGESKIQKSSITGVMVNNNGTFFGYDNLFSFNVEAFYMRGSSSTSVFFSNLFTFNDKIGKVMGTHSASFKDNEFSFNKGWLYIDQNSKTAIQNNIFSNNKSVGSLLGIRGTATVKIENSTFVKNETPIMIDLLGGSKTKIVDSIMSSTVGTAIRCNSFGDIQFSNFWDNTLNTTGSSCTISSTTTIDPRFVPGPLGSFYLDQASPSPMVDSGSQLASSIYGPGYTTNPLHVDDAGQVDKGFHYPY